MCVISFFKRWSTASADLVCPHVCVEAGVRRITAGITLEGGLGIQELNLSVSRCV